MPSTKRTRERGYTAVEVIMSMAVMVIGAAAAISMQKATVQGDLDARKTDVANAVLRAWQERLQRDAMQWTCPSPACPSTSNMVNAWLISNKSTAAAGSHVTNKWFLPTDYMGGNPETMSPGFDILGRDLPQSLLAPNVQTAWPGATFCVNVRLSWLVPQTIPTDPYMQADPGLIRADIRVLWPRGIVSGMTTNGQFCDTNSATADDPETLVPAAQRPFFHAIYTTTTLMENPTQ